MKEYRTTENETLTGNFTYTVYRSESYMVSKFSTSDGNITVTGPSFDYQKSKKYNLTGNYVEHPRYGFQFSYLKVEDYLPDEKEGVVSYLHATFKGVGKKTAEKIVAHFGKDTLNILKEDPNRIHEVKLSEKQYESLLEGFQALNDPKNEAVYRLVSGGFSASEALLIYNHFKDKTDVVIENNPYLIYLSVYGISFSHVCLFAENLEFEDKLIKLKEAFLVYALKEITFSCGDTWLYRNEFEKQYYRNFKDDDLDDVLNRAISDRYIYEENDRFYLYEEYRNELIISDFLNTKNETLNLEEDIIQSAISSVSKQLDVEYDEGQLMAIKNFFSNDISIITGGPGTGKTTVVKSLVAIFGEYLPYNSIVVVAPTGRAAKRIAEICHVESKTIHSLLRWNKETNTFVFNEENPLLYDAIIIDEFSMVDNFLFASLVKASGGLKKLCIIGDDHQLPSIRQGNLLYDLIESGCFTLTELKENHRQKDGNEIIRLCEDIIKQNVNPDSYSKDIRFLSLSSPKDIIELIDKTQNDGYEFDDIQVLAPMYKGNYGIDNLNGLLQEHFNPRSPLKKEREVNGILYREGDKILQLKNRPSDDVYNGDIGILKEINSDEKYFMIDFAGTIVFYQFSDLQDISLAYALSVHKAQGSEYRVCLFVLPPFTSSMLTQNLIYTAVSRAKSKLYILGLADIFLKGTGTESRKRKTTLLNLLIGKNE